MARAATWHPLSSDPGPDFTMAPADPPRPPRPELSRWELGEILKTSTVPRDRLMSADSGSHQNHGTFLPSHFDHSMDHNPPHSANHLPVHHFDNDKMDVTDHPSYDMFPHPPPQPPQPQPQQQPSFPHQRFRSNTSPAAAPSYGTNSESMYPGMFSNDSVPSFHSPQSAGPYDMMGSMSSSLSSGKATPLTPSDPTGGLPFSAGPPNGIKQDFSDLMSDRRLSTMSSASFQSEMQDEFSLAVNSQPNFGSTTLPPFSDRIPRFPSDGFLGQPELQGHPSEPLRSVPPQATHNRFDGGTSYDQISNYLIPSPQNDLGLRIPGVEDTMIRMRMGQMGASADLHTFIR